MAQLPKGDLWVFGYGSLMWSPCFGYSAEGARPRARLPPRALHPVDALPRHAAQARPGDGPVPRRLVLGHGLPHRCATPRRALARLWQREMPRRVYAPRLIQVRGPAGAWCARSPSSPTRRIRPTCASSTCTGARAGRAGHRPARAVRRLHPQYAGAHARGRRARSAPRAHPARRARFAPLWLRATICGATARAARLGEVLGDRIAPLPDACWSTATAAGGVRDVLPRRASGTSASASRARRPGRGLRPEVEAHEMRRAR